MALDETNLGYKLLKLSGWDGTGVEAPVAVHTNDTRGLGKRELDDAALEATKRPKSVAPTARKTNPLAEFFCAVCDKQYKTVAEFATHLSSYDHHHRKRFAEMKEAHKPKIQRRKDDERSNAELERRVQAAAPSQPPQADSLTSHAAITFSGWATKKPKRRT